MADLSALNHLYKAFAENGIVDIGLQAALDVGVQQEDYIQVPRKCLRMIWHGQNSTIANVANNASNTRIRDIEPVIITNKGHTYRNLAFDIRRPQQLDDEDLQNLIIVNLRAIAAQSYDDEYRDLIVAAHVTASLLGAVEPYGEVVLVDDPDDIKAEEAAYAPALPTISPKGMLVCAAAALNHYAINHTTGQGRLQGFAWKVARVLGLKYPMGKDTASREILEAATRAFYAAGHPVSKRNMLFVLDPDITGVSAAWTPGMPHPATTVSDDFVRLRIGVFQLACGNCMSPKRHANALLPVGCLLQCHTHKT